MAVPAATGVPRAGAGGDRAAALAAVRRRVVIEEGMHVYGRRFNGQRVEGVVRWVADGVARVDLDDGRHWLAKVAKLRPVRSAAPTMPRITRSVDRSGGLAKPVPKAKRVRSRAYLAKLRELDCVFCGRPGPSEASHHGPSGTASKASDLDALPSCRECHERWHRTGCPHPSWGWLTRAQKRERFAFLAGQVRERLEREGAGCSRSAG